MFKNHIDIKLKHKKFINEICNSSVVFCLENDTGLATSSSNELEDDDGEPIEIVCFWSTEIMAKVCAKNGWNSYKPVEISLSDFIENWCIGIGNDGLLIGTNFDHQMFGYEIEGYELILELITELKNNKKEIKFQKFENLEDLENQIKEVLQ